MKKMTKLMLIALMSVVVPAAAGAQTPKTAPVAPVPQAAPAPKVAPAPHVLPTVVIPELADFYLLDAQDMKLRAMEANLAAQTISGEKMQAITEESRKAMEQARAKMEEMRVENKFNFDNSFSYDF